jgi:phthiocerol/phenolphthiocerol synthesis type-I polyketide synthase B
LEHPEIWGGIVDVDDSVPPELIAHYVLAEVGAGDGEDQVVYQAGRRRVPRLQQRLPRSAAPATLRADTSHLVIGATGNIGPALIRQLSEMGAGTIVAVSRHAGSRLDDLAAALASNGTTLIEVAADAADEAAMTELFARFGTELPPLDGIYVAALAGGPVLLRDMTDDDVHRMFRPKVDVVSVLHKLTLKTPVRHFVLFSSITGLIGSRWLGHYTATGAFLDAFAYARRALGLSATVVDWGLWKVADDQQSTSDAGLQPMPDEVAIRALPAVIGADSAVQCAVVGADWNLLAAAYRMRGALRVVDDVLCDESADEPAEIHLGQHTQRWITLTNQVEAAGSAPLPGTLLGEHIEVSAEPGAHVWRAQLAPEAKPYPGGHRVQGVEVVPASVLLHTLSVAAAERGASTLRDVRFEYPIVVDQPRVIQVVLEEQAEHVDGCVTVASAPTADTPAHRWIRHVSGRIADGVPDDERQCANASGANEITAYNSSSAVELQRAWGIEGQPFPWSVGSSRSVPGGLKAYVGVPDASTAALLDAAIHVARLADTSNLKLMFPAGVETVRFNAELTDELGSVEVRRCGGGDDELIVDIALKGPHGGVCVDIRGLRYAAAESSFAEPALTDDEPAASVAWSEMSAENILSELEIRLQALLARELGMPPAAVDLDRPFPELGLDSMMAMTVLRDAKQLSGIDLSATMLWNHPTISSLASFLTEMLEPQANSEEHSAEALPDSANSLLDALFDSVESATAGSESGI